MCRAVANGGGTEQKARDQQKPDAVEQVAAKHDRNPADSKQCCHALPDPAGPASRLAVAATHAPDNRAQDSPTVQRESGQKVKQGQHQVDCSQPAAGRARYSSQVGEDPKRGRQD